MLRLHWRRPAIRGKIRPRRFSVAHKSQRLILGDDDGSGHCEVVQSNEGLWIHSAARWWRQRCVRTHQRSRTRRSEFTQRRQTVEYEIESNRGKESAINLKVK